MQISQESIQNEFKLFLDSISSLEHNQKLACFSIEITEIEISTLITSNVVSKSDYFYWKIKDENLEFLAFSPLINFNEIGDDRLSKTNAKVKEIEQKLIPNNNFSSKFNFPFVVGGIKFTPNQKSEIWKTFSDSDWFIPKWIFFKNDLTNLLIYNFWIDSKNFKLNENELYEILYQANRQELNFEDELNNKLQYPIHTNSFNSWENIVNKALQKISEGMLTKVVLSRQVKYNLQSKVNIAEFLQKLDEKYPKCYTFAYRRNEDIFFGASPEKLAKFSQGWIEVDALAGSAPRGKNENEDLEYENFLLNSEKNLFEQRAVVYFIHNLLMKISDEIIFDDKPVIRKLPNIQHLWTIMKAKLKKDAKIFDVLMKLHPTPAICGDPWKIAKDFILENEPHDRGLYSGNIGWFNQNCNGEFAVGIRSALLKNNELYAYAGCGIVEGSEPQSEFEESEIKLKPILSLFVDEKIYQS